MAGPASRSEANAEQLSLLLESTMTSNLRRRTLATCLLIMFLGTLLGSLMGTPVLRLFEACVCRAYYLLHNPSKVGAGGDIPEELCKEPPIQIEVAYINSTIGIMTSVIGKYDRNYPKPAYN